MNRLQKAKKKRKILIIILFIFLFFLGTSYSLLNQDLSLTGKISIPAKENDRIELTGQVDSCEEYKVLFISFGYRVVFTITNNTEEDIDGWVAVISIPNITGLKSISTSTTNTKADSYASLNSTTVTITVPNGDTNGVIKSGESKTFVFGAYGADSATMTECYSLRSGVSAQSDTVTDDTSTVSDEAPLDEADDTINDSNINSETNTSSNSKENDFSSDDALNENDNVTNKTNNSASNSITNGANNSVGNSTTNETNNSAGNSTTNEINNNASNQITNETNNDTSN